MKHFILAIIALCSFGIASAQSYGSGYLDYEPAYGYGQQYSKPKKQEAQVVTAYFINKRGSFQKTKLKIISENTTSGMLVVSYLLKTDYGSSWQPAHAFPEKVSSLDPDIIRENFDYKVFMNASTYDQQGSYVYF